MEKNRYQELQAQAATGIKQARSLPESPEIRQRVAVELAALRSDRTVLLPSACQLTEEEQRLLSCFRASGDLIIPCEVFTWVLSPED